MRSYELINQLHTIYENELKLLNELLRNSLSRRFPIPQFLLGGKRLRPLAVMLSSRNVNEDVLKAALSVELIHASSLIHDDIIDEDEIRRNFPTINAAYGRTVAILAGDYLFVKSIEIISEIGRNNLMREIIKASKNMVRGELDEEILPFEEKIQLDTYYDIIYNKTASLFEASFTLGAMLSEFDVELFRRAGRFFGMAYQITDDCEDFLNGKDEGKITLPFILAYNRNENVIEMSYDELREFVLSEGIVDEVMSHALDFLSKADELLSHTENYDKFRLYTDYLKNRIYEIDVRS